MILASTHINSTLILARWSKFDHDHGCKFVEIRTKMRKQLLFTIFFVTENTKTLSIATEEKKFVEINII